MGEFSTLHWITLFLVPIVFAGNILGIIRGVKNSSILHVFLSLFIPIYGLFYFFMSKKIIIGLK